MADVSKLSEAIAFHRTGRMREAALAYRKAIKAEPKDPLAHAMLGLLTLESGDLSEGIRLSKIALDLDPNQPELAHNIGLGLLNAGRPAEALDYFARARELHVDHADLHINRGVTLRRLGRIEEALSAYETAVARAPSHAVAHKNRANALKDLGRAGEALQSYARAIALSPASADIYYARGTALLEMGSDVEALADFDRAVALDPKSADAHYNRGIALARLSRPLEALQAYDATLRLAPKHAGALGARGICLQSMRRTDAAIEAYGKAIRIAPDRAEFYHGRGTVLCELGRYEDAVGDFNRARKIDPDLPYLLGDHLHARMHLCLWHDHARLEKEILGRLDAGRLPAAPFQLLAIRSSAGQQHECATAFARNAFRPNTELPTPHKAAEKIRVGYYSADFRQHAISHLIANMIEQHDRSRFEIVGFSFGVATGDPLTERLSQGFDTFIDVGNQADSEVAALSRQMGIDIAVDLHGYTGNSRTAIFAQRAAPLQVSYLGYPGTMGAPFIDYILADSTVIPPSDFPAFTEKVVRLPGAYQINDPTRAIAAATPARRELGLPDNGVVFCCFNSHYKITPERFDIWMRILKQVEGSVLWLLEGRLAAMRSLRAEAQSRGLAGDRLVFAPRLEQSAHLARHRAADLFLDTLPYNAHTTARDALWAGLPVLTEKGNTFASRVCASLLGAVGLPELITSSAEDYESLAVGLANDASRLAALRARLAANRLTAPLFDARSTTRAIENAFIEMIVRQRSGLSPSPLEVDSHG